MSGARRLLLLIALAAIAIVPLRAFGVVGGESAGGLSVSASLGGCGVAGDGIVCEIEASFNGVEGADYYTASVTRADGSVQDVGSVGGGEGGGSASIYVPYVGAGVYSVTVSAWGTPDEGVDGERELLDRTKADANRDKDSGKVSAEAAEEAETLQPEDPAAPVDPVAETAPVEPAAPETQTLPECQPETTDATAAPAAGGDAAETSAAPAAAAPAPNIECTTPSADSNGPCCPPDA